MSEDLNKVAFESTHAGSSSTASQSDLMNKLKEILKANHITDHVSAIIIKDSGLQGEGNGSQTDCVTIHFEDLRQKPLNLFIKRELENPIRQKINKETKMFEKEAVFFMEYLPAARELCRKMGREDLLEIYPKCYYGDTKLVVLENLVMNKNYSILNKEEMQDFDAAKFALTTLAKHHAISYAFIKEIGGHKVLMEKFPAFSCEMYKTEIAKEMLPSIFEDAVTTNLNIVEKSNLKEKEKKETVEILKMLQGQVFTKMVESLTANPDDDLRVLNHGDYWNNNMMFRKDIISGKLTGHIAIDFQVLRYCTPGVDLGYYLFTSVKPEVRQSRLQELVSIYLDVLKETTLNLGYPMKVNYEQIYNDFCKTFSYGYFWGLTVATGAGYAVLKDMDKNESDNGTSNFTQLVTKWIEKNPGKSEEIANLVVSIVKEYKQLTS